MARLLLTLCTLFVNLLAIFETHAGLPWVTLTTKRGNWLTLIEVSPRTEYLLRPQPTLKRSKETIHCAGTSEVSLEVSLWTSEMLTEARGALIESGRCKSTDVCRVLPYTVERFGLRDQMSQWQSESPWVFVSGVLPPSHRFKLQRKPQRTYESSHCRLKSLVVDMVLINGLSMGRKDSPPLVFTSSDVEWAAKLLGVLPKNELVIAVDKRRLRLLAQSLLMTKLETLESVGERVSLTITPAAMKSVQLALISRTVKYGVYRRALNKTVPGHRRLSDIEPVYILKKLSALRRFEVRFQSHSRASDLIRISVALSDKINVKKPATVARTKTSSLPKAKYSIRRPAATNSQSTTEKGEKKETSGTLERRIAKLEAQIKKLTNITQQLLTRTNNGDQSDLNITIAAKAPSHAQINDCSEIKTRGFSGEIFYLKPARRLVRCSDKGGLIALSRTKGNIDFNRNWTEYRDGFGDPRIGDYWLGLKYLSEYTSEGDRCMRLEMKPWKLKIADRYASYADVHIGDENKHFPLFYDKFQGNVAKDSLSDMNKRPFSTFDRDNDSFIGNCALSAGGGNWYKYCYSANIFGRHKYLTNMSLNPQQRQFVGSESMCWKGIHSSQGMTCSPLVSVKMIFSRPYDSKDSKKILYEYKADLGTACKSMVKRITIKSTGLYHVTAGGGSGGMTKGGTPGGRGALIRATLLLKRGKQLAVIIGCGGSQVYDTADGGNATILMDATSWKPILVAGGGGGAANGIPGSHGVAVDKGGDAWWAKDTHSLKSKMLLGQSNVKRGGNWTTCSRTADYCTTGGRVRIRVETKRESYHKQYYGRRWRTKTIIKSIPGAGGGGGYQGGISGDRHHVAGGGGSSFCHPTLLANCEKIEGGNRHQLGFLIIEKSICF